MSTQGAESAWRERGVRQAPLLVGAAMSISLDGFIAGRDAGADLPLGENGTRLFDWYFRGDTPSRHYGERFRLSAISAQVFDQRCDHTAAVICGRRTYDIARGFGGSGPLPGVPLLVLTHRPPPQVPVGAIPYVFVTDGIGSAIEQARLAAARSPRGRSIMLMGGETIRAAISAGLLDELELDLVPVLLGGGVPLLHRLAAMGLDVLRVIEAPGVTHLHYRVLKTAGAAALPG
jgi:dihydrofolate reductase